MSTQPKQNAPTLGKHLKQRLQQRIGELGVALDALNPNSVKDSLAYVRITDRLHHKKHLFKEITWR